MKTLLNPCPLDSQNKNPSSRGYAPTPPLSIRFWTSQLNSIGFGQLNPNILFMKGSEELTLQENFDHVIENAIFEEDKVLLNEAKIGAENGALRSAYIMLWLACVESIKRRFKDLEPFDNVIGSVNADIRRKEEAGQSIDKFLVGKYLEHGYIESMEHRSLLEIYSSRCIFAHPYERAPREGKVMSALEDIGEMVINRPLKFRQGFASRKINEFLTNPQFVSNRRESVETFAEDVFQKTDDSIHFWIVKTLCNETDVSDPTLYEKAMFFIQKFLCLSDIKIFDGQDLPSFILKHVILVHSLCKPSLFKQLDGRSKEVVVNSIFNWSKNDKTFFRNIYELYSKELLEARAAEEFKDSLNAQDIKELYQIGIPSNHIFDRLINEFKSSNWYRQDDAMKLVHNMHPDGILSLSDQQLFILGNNILQAAVGGERNSKSFIRTLYLTSNKWPASMIKGIFAENFINDNNKVRPKLDYLSESINGVRQLKVEDISKIADDLHQRLSSYGKFNREELVWSPSDLDIVKSQKDSIPQFIHFFDYLIQKIEETYGQIFEELSKR